MQSTLKLYEQADTDRSIKHDQLRQEIQSLHHHITTIEASRHRLEDDLKYETSARSQLVTEIYHMRKVAISSTLQPHAIREGLLPIKLKLYSM